MRDLNSELEKRTIITSKLLKYGFKKYDEEYIYKTIILDGLFEVVIVFSLEENYSKLVEIETDEEYVLVDVDSAVRRVCW